MRGVVPACHRAEVTRSASLHQRSVTAEAHGYRCGLRAFTTPCTWHHSLNHIAGAAPLITALRSIIVTAFHCHAASSITALCPSSAPSSVLHYRARHHFRSTPAAPHVSRPPASARSGADPSLLQSTRRVWHIVLPLFLHSLRFGRSPRPRLWASSLHCVPSGAPSPQRASPTYILRIRNRLLPTGRSSQTQSPNTRMSTP